MENKSQPKFDKRTDRIYKGTIALLLLVVAGLTVMLLTNRKSFNVERETSALANTQLQYELDSLLTAHNLIKLEYDSILVDKDSIIMANAQEIQKLIAQQADYFRIRRQLNLLREVTKSYISDIDSLVSINQVLRAENVAIREEIQRVTVRSTELAADKEVLTSKVEAASALHAYQFSAEAIRIRTRGREETTDRASRAEQIKVCFTIAENPIAPAGNIRVYMRIAAPNGNILRISDEDAQSFTHGTDTLQFSASAVVDYQNRATPVCLYWQRLTEFEPGLYMVSLYTDEYKLGETAITLR